MEHFDVLIVGAGISGIGAAYHLQTKCPGKRYAILEGRETLGGTWDLFRYPGIRSDSDMYTLGFAFRPWTNPKAIADGPSILDYLKDTAREYGIDRNIRYGMRVEAAEWSTADAHWKVRVRKADDELVEYTTDFLFMCAGYYRYDEGYTPDFDGMDDFEGTIVHPQLWPEDLEWAGKKVVVIGSGATAVTLVPELAPDAEHLVMLQRSPTYMFSGPSEDKIANWLRERLPAMTAYQITRWKNVLLGMAFYNYARKFPEKAKAWFLKNTQQALGQDYPIDPNFTPRYDVWDQRVCLVPEGDLFDSVKRGEVEVVTDEVDTFTKTGIRLKSGKEIDADLVVTATGFKVRFLGGLELVVDGREIQPTDLYMYRGLMFSGVPNLAMCIGYTNASWTLKVDLTCEYVCRLLNHMERKGHRTAMPVPPTEMTEEPLIDFSSGYVLRARDQLPKQGSKWPWRLYQNYVLDMLLLRHGRVNDGVMRFR